jgi:hypothetical protein
MALYNAVPPLKYAGSPVCHEASSERSRVR